MCRLGMVTVSFLVALGVALVPTLTGCGTDREASSAGGPAFVGGGRADQRPLELRRVLASDVSPLCADVAGSGGPGGPACDRETLLALDCADPGAPVPAEEVRYACEPGREATEGVPPHPPVRFALAPADVVGGVEGAGYVAKGTDTWAVDVDLGEAAAEQVAALSEGLAKGPDGDTVAFVLDGVVLAAPYSTQTVSDGRLQINGGFTEDRARELAAAIAAGG
ncbi:SecDF P1 head subdomain-containing protein [Nocardioides litoris]|uniref:SecDF P1 head subdomain-containing protein n=1 Tax=Nocardioides litoris TaxID=1926648 RepID=UPI001FEAF79E|nr:hypothetical protein [Nocardioides litoris]